MKETKQHLFLDASNHQSADHLYHWGMVPSPSDVLGTSRNYGEIYWPTVCHGSHGSCVDDKHLLWKWVIFLNVHFPGAKKNFPGRTRERRWSSSRMLWSSSRVGMNRNRWRTGFEHGDFVEETWGRIISIKIPSYDWTHFVIFCLKDTCLILFARNGI